MIYEYMNTMGALITLGLGIFGTFFPLRAAKFTGLSWETKEGFSEFRATFGGLFVALGLFPLVSGMPVAYVLVGIVWVFTSFGRVLSIFLDQGLTQKNVKAVLFEGGIGTLMLVGNFSFTIELFR
jgi:hypothetical protein